MVYSQRLCVLALVLSTSATIGLATDRTWTGQGGNNLWTNAMNWADYTAPTSSADTATFPSGTPASVQVDTSFSVKTIYFRNPGKTLTINTKITGTNGFEFNGGGGTIVLANPANDYPGNTLMTSSGTLSNGNVTVTGGTIVNGRVATKVIEKNGTGTLNLSSLVTLSTNRAQRALTPGLWEGMIRSSWDTTSPNPCQAIMLTPRAAIGSQAANTTYAGGLWNGNNHTYIYSGYIWNRTSAEATWTFAENFDDSVKLTIDNSVLISGGSSWNIPTKGTITLAPGAHAFEVRFGQGVGGAAGNNAQWWTNTLMSFAVDWQGRDSTNLNNYAVPADPGDGSLFTCSLSDPQASTGLLAEVTVTLADGTALDLNGGIYAVGLLTGSGAVSNGTLAAGTAISPAGDDAVGTLSLDGISFAEDVVYRLTVIGDTCDRLTSTGTLDFSGVSIIASTEPDCTVSTYVIAHADGGITGTKPTVSGFPSKYKIIRKGTDLLLTSQGGAIILLK